MFKKHILFHIFYIVAAPLFPVFSVKKITLIGRLDQGVVIGQPFKAFFGNVTPLYHKREFQHTNAAQGDVYFPGRKLKTTIDALQGVQKQCALIENNSLWSDLVLCNFADLVLCSNSNIENVKKSIIGPL